MALFFYPFLSDCMLKLFSPAKINLFLRVVSKRADGYHNLSSLFQTISLGDTLTIELADQDSLTCSQPNVPVNSSNLIIKARDCFRQKTGILQPLSIHLQKNIPMQAGLGGGSSNAATMLWACNQLMHTQISDDQLALLGASLGSDVPFFFSHGTAYCTGRGDLVKNMDSIGQSSVWIVKPMDNVSTPEIFKRFRLNSSIDSVNSEDDLSQFLNGQLAPFNDLEETTFSILPNLKQLKQDLISQGFQTVLMSGSGSAFFCLGQPNNFKKPDCFHYQAAYLRRHPHQWYG